MRSTLAPAAALALLAATAACEPATPVEAGELSTRFGASPRDEAVAPDNFFTTTPALHGASRGHLQGTMGSAVDLDDPATVDTVHDDTGWTTLHLTMVGERGAAMAIVDISGGIDQLVRLEAPVRFTSDEYDERLHVMVQGCSGPTEGDWLYDAPADTTVVTVTPTEEEGTVEVEVVSTLPSASADGTGPSLDDPTFDTARGTFLVSPR